VRSNPNGLIISQRQARALADSEQAPAHFDFPFAATSGRHASPKGNDAPVAYGTGRASQLSRLTGLRVGLRFDLGLGLDLAIAQILSLESGIIAPIRGKCETHLGSAALFTVLER
jgi:hypothetical protein